MVGKVPITAQGFNALEEELKELKYVERPNIITAIAIAREHGDLSENAEYHSAREKQSFIEGRILELESLISRADVIDVSKLSGDTVRFGAKVLLVDEETEENTSYQIVGDSESDIKAGKLGISAPLSRALINKKKGDSVETQTPSGARYFEIMQVEYA